MEKSHPVPPKQVSTRPETRIVDESKKGDSGSVRSAPEPIPATTRRGVAYAERIPLSESAKAGGKDVPMPAGNATSLQNPSDVKVETES